MSLQTNSVQFTVPFVAGKLRSRVQRVPGGIHSYTPDKTTAHMKQIAKAYRAASIDKYGMVKRARKGTSVLVYVEVHQKLPKSRPKKIPCELDTFKPDVDNVLKLVMDGLNGVAYEDDKQVQASTVIKYPRTRDDNCPYMLINIIWEENEKEKVCHYLNSLIVNARQLLRKLQNYAHDVQKPSAQ